MFTFAVEEQFLLLNPLGRLARVTDVAVRAAGDPVHVQPDFLPFQIRTSSGACTRTEELRARLSRARTMAANGAYDAGALLVPTAMPPVNDGWPEQALTGERYSELARRFPHAVASTAACACQVHLGILDRDLATGVLTRLRPWLAAILALSANSPIVQGADSGWASRRYVARLDWPTFRPPAGWRDAQSYDRTVRSLVDRGAATDVRNVQFLARLSTRRPGVEVRVADTCLTVDDTALVAAAVRALVETLIEEIHEGVPAEAVAGRQVSRELLWAAHHGLQPPGDRMHRPGRLPAGVERLYDRIGPALAAHGDREEVDAGLARVRDHGNGAVRQRRLWQAISSPAAFAEALCDIGVGATAIP